MMNEVCGYAVFTGEGGLDIEIELASKFFKTGETYEVVGGNISRFRTRLKIRGVPDFWNSSMFEFDKELLTKLTNDYCRKEA